MLNPRITTNLSRPLLFLDFDDVICLNTKFTGFDVMYALSQIEKGTASLEDFEEVWHEVFDHEAKKYLRALHEEFNPFYVLSTSWSNRMNRAALVAVLKQTELNFIAENLHPTWQTIRGFGGQTRMREIGSWRGRHPEFDHLWIVLDDECSGTGFDIYPEKSDKQFIILCKEGAGLTKSEYIELQIAFNSRLDLVNKDAGPIMPV